MKTFISTNHADNIRWDLKLLKSSIKVRSLEQLQSLESIKDLKLIKKV